MTSPRAPHVPLSVLDLVRVSNDVGTAIAESMAAARTAEEHGYLRYWFAEHHNTPGVASSATAVLIGAAADATESIRVGSGGIMLPNHAPLTVAESFGTLARLHPDRIDLGLGRAPGTDPMTARALARSSAEPQEFARAIYDLQGWFSPSGEAHSAPLHCTPAAGTEVPIWVLGSTVAGASIAAQLGLPFSVASHFAPEQVDRAIEVYRRDFSTEAPTARITEPRVMVGVNVLSAESTAAAEREFTTTQQMFLAIRRGERGPVPPPVDDLSTRASAPELAMADAMLSFRAVGEPELVVERLEQIVQRTGADELITVTYAHDAAVRRHSLELTARAWGRQG